jgi:hypothetical protein
MKINASIAANLALEYMLNTKSFALILQTFEMQGIMIPVLIQDEGPMMGVFAYGTEPEAGSEFTCKVYANKKDAINAALVEAEKDLNGYLLRLRVQIRNAIMYT